MAASLGAPLPAAATAAAWEAEVWVASGPGGVGGLRVEARFFPMGIAREPFALRVPGLARIHTDLDDSDNVGLTGGDFVVFAPDGAALARAEAALVAAHAARGVPLDGRWWPRPGGAGCRAPARPPRRAAALPDRAGRGPRPRDGA